MVYGNYDIVEAMSTFSKIKIRDYITTNGATFLGGLTLEEKAVVEQVEKERKDNPGFIPQQLDPRNWNWKCLA